MNMWAHATNVLASLVALACLLHGLAARQYAVAQTPRQERTVTIEINPQLPPYRFHLRPKPGVEEGYCSGGPATIPTPGGTTPISAGRTTGDTPENLADGCLAGWIDVFREGAPAAIQTIEVKVDAVSYFPDSFRAQDVNFDGYKDISVLHDHGGKWGQGRYWLFDPPSGLFVTNTLSRELSDLTANNRVFDSQAREIRTDHFEGHCFPVKKTYKILNGHLALVWAQLLITNPPLGTREEAAAAANQGYIGLCVPARVAVSPTVTSGLEPGAEGAFWRWVQNNLFPEESDWVVQEVSVNEFVYVRQRNARFQGSQSVRIFRQGDAWTSETIP
jgi:hypothetical protein